MSASCRDILRYLREAYRENGSRGGIWDIFGNSVSRRFFPGGDDLLNSRPESGDGFYLRDAEAERMGIEAHLYEREKDLRYLSLFVLGWVERIEGRPEPICAPLFIFPAELDREGYAHGANLRIRTDQGQLNQPVLEAIGGADFALALEAEIQPGLISDGCVGIVRRHFNEAFPDCDSEALLRYPLSETAADLRKRFEKMKSDPDAPFVLLPAHAIALCNKSGAMRGVLHELDSLASPESRLSAPLGSLLGEPTPAHPPAPPGRVPVTLSDAQRRVISAARSEPLSLVIGPPGTGKSFTIAALAIETLGRGGSVLIASKMDHAVDVVGNLIENLIGLDGVVTRGGRSEYLRDLKTFTEDLLAGIHTSGAWGGEDLASAEAELDKLEGRIGTLRRKLEKRLRQEAQWGALLADSNPGLLTRLRARLIIAGLSRRKRVWEMTAELEDLIDLRHRQALRFTRASRIHHLALKLEKHRGVFQNFSRAIRARTGTRQAGYFEKIDLRTLLGALPVWLVNLSDVHQILPLEEGAFDLAIIDEASQCDIASALPLLQRARRAVIVGDPKQLRHLSFLPVARQTALGEQYGLSATQRERFNFRETSLLDLASQAVSSQASVNFLDKHFRSHPDIIGFSNREFYSGKLRVMTPHRRPHAAPDDALRFHHLPSAARESNGSNPAEAEAILDAIRAVYRAQEAFTGCVVHTIGILSPFRSQVEHLRQAIGRDPLGAGIIGRHKLLIGTAHSFQGEERDLMFLSLCLDDSSPAASFRFLEKPDLFNVAITRARLQNRVWHSFDPAGRPAGSLLGRYLVSMESRNVATNTHPGLHDRFAAEVAEALRGAGAEVRIGHALAGMELDLLYTLNGTTRGIDLIGYPGATAAAFPLERLIIFRHVGLPVLPLPYSAWRHDRALCEKWLLDEG